MRITPRQLLNSPLQAIPPFVWIAGDDPYVLSECYQHIITLCKTAGFEKITLELPTSDLLTFKNRVDQLGFFASSRLIDIRWTQVRFTKDLEEFLLQRLHSTLSSSLLLFQSSFLDKKTLNTPFLRALEQKAWFIPIWPLNTQEAHFWLERKAKTLKLSLTEDALLYLQEHTEGRLYAAIQLLEYIHLLQITETIDRVFIIKLLCETGHYTLSMLTDTVLAGDPKKTFQMLTSLKKEGVHVSLILWSLTQLLQELLYFKTKSAPPTNNFLKPARLTALNNAAKRLKKARLSTLLSSLATIDHALKTGTPLLAEQMLTWIFLELAGLTSVEESVLYCG